MAATTTKTAKSKNGTKKAAAKKVAKKKATTKKAATKVRKPTKHAYWGGWNREQTSLLMYDKKGEWTGKLTAGSLVGRLEAGEDLQPLTKLNPERRAIDLKEVKARVAELAQTKPKAAPKKSAKKS